MDVADSSLHADVRSHVVMRLAEFDLADRCRDADAAEVDQLVALEGGPAARVLPTAYSHHDVHLLIVPRSGDLSEEGRWLDGLRREPVTPDRGARPAQRWTIRRRLSPR